MVKYDRILLEIVTANAENTSTWKSSFFLSLPSIPLIAAFISIVCFFLPGDFYAGSLGPKGQFFLPLLTGTIFACLFWVLLAWAALRFTAVDLANAASYDKLCTHLSRLDSSIEAVCADAQGEYQFTYDLLQRLKTKSPPGNINSPSLQTTLQLAPSGLSTTFPLTASDDMVCTRTLLLAYRNAIYVGLMQQSDTWMMGTGYIKLWSLMNKAEELLISIEAPERVVQGAVYDDMCLRQSHVANSAEWTKKLSVAVTIISSKALSYLASSSIAPDTQNVTTGSSLSVTSVGDGQLPTALSTPPALENEVSVTSAELKETHQSSSSTSSSLDFFEQAQARTILQLVHRVIADFNAKNWIDV